MPAVLRALVACGWFGIQTWIGGLALNALLSVIAHDRLDADFEVEQEQIEVAEAVLDAERPEP